MEKKTLATVRVRPKKMSLKAPSEPETHLYDKDFYKWTKTQAKVLRSKRKQLTELTDLDIKNLIEEISSLGKNDKRSLRSQTIRLRMHLLKKEYQSSKQVNSNSWNRSILEATREIRYLIEDSPSLRNELEKMYLEAYQDARQDAAAETRLNITTFPVKCPWTLHEILPFVAKKRT